MQMRFVDVHGFAGGLSLGIALSGFTLVGKKESAGGFGANNMLANRHILGDKWDLQVGSYEEWEPHDAELIIGNPPCSGFSLLSSKSFRGINSKANACMWGITDFASKTAPPIFAFESVQGAYTSGLELMRDLRSYLEDKTGQQYDLTHVLHSARAMGNPQLRRRYMFVAHRVPFGMEMPKPVEMPTVGQAIGDLEDLELTWEAQPYTRAPRGPWAAQKRNSYGVVDGHMHVDDVGTRRLRQIAESGYWSQGMHFSDVIRALYENNAEMPEIYAKKLDKLVASNFDFGWHTPVRLHENRTCPAITGSGMQSFVHYKKNRTLTHREIARLMGFPDNWRIAPNAHYTQLRNAWGKGVTVDVGLWFGEWLYKSLMGMPGSMKGEPLGERERVINITNAYKQFEAAA